MLTVRALLPSLLVASLAAQGDNGTTSLYRVPGPVPAAVQTVLQTDFDVLGSCCSMRLYPGDMDVVVGPQEVAAFLAVAPGAKLIRRGRPYFPTAGGIGIEPPDPLYYTVAEIEQAIDAQVAAFPSLAVKVDLTTLPGARRTHENRQIFALKVSDNVGVDEDEPAIVLAAQHHARELNSPHMVISAMDRVLQGYASDPQLRALVDGYELWFVPMCNPDGVNHVWNVDNFWRKNRRNNGGTFGVDQNRNYEFLWGLCGASTFGGSQTYRGPAPGSEPETATLRALMESVRPEIYIDFHSFGQEVLSLYAPCASVSSAIGAMGQRYADDLRMPMSYAFRSPSASGEAPHDHWGRGGAMSFLIEVGTSFQPPFSATVAEESRVWPGLRRALTTWQPAVRGHVRSVFMGQPVAATITFTPNQFSHGEVTEGRARDGRYGLWLPLGTWNVTWSAPGFQSRTKSVTVTAYDQPQTIDIDLEPTWQPATLVKSGSERIGTAVQLTYTSPGDAGLMHFLGWSLGTTPGIDLGGCRTLPLNHDFLLDAALATNSVLAPTWTVLDVNGQSTSTLQIPNTPVLVNFTTWMCGLTLDPQYLRTIKKFSAPVSVTPLP